MTAPEQDTHFDLTWSDQQTELREYVELHAKVVARCAADGLSYVNSLNEALHEWLEIQEIEAEQAKTPATPKPDLIGRVAPEQQGAHGADLTLQDCYGAPAAVQVTVDLHGNLHVTTSDDGTGATVRPEDLVELVARACALRRPG